jgi:hypothetical protein
VYDKQPVTIEQAINKDHQKQKRIKIEFGEWENSIFDSIYYKNDELYGLLTRPKEKKKVQMSETKYNINNRPYTYTYNVTVKTKMEIMIEVDSIVKIRLSNLKKSRNATAFTVIGSILVVPVTFIMIALFHPDSWFYIGN